MTELIFTGDTWDVGRQKINAFWQTTLSFPTGATNIWISGLTGNNSIKTAGNTANTSNGNYSLVTGSYNSGLTKFSTILNGNSNLTNTYYGLVGNGTNNIAGYNSIQTHSTIVNGTNNKSLHFHTFIGNGTNNTANYFHATVVAGNRNQASGNRSFIGNGQLNTASTNSYQSAILNGQRNLITSPRSSILNGYLNIINGNFSTIANGVSNLANGYYSFIGGGTGNTASTTCSFIGNGALNLTNGTSSFVGNGTGNTISGNASLIGNGQYNTVNADYSSIVGGQQNIASGLLSFIGGGIGNSATTKHSFIGGGQINITSGLTLSYANGAFIGGGKNNIAVGYYSIIVGGHNNLTNNQSFVGGGQGNTATGNLSFVGCGNTNKATGTHSFIGAGAGNSISGNSSAIIAGQGNTLINNYGVAFGKGATDSGRGNYQMVMAGGAGNTVRLSMSSGDMWSSGVFNVGGADYSEYFEWNDKNPSADTRYGYAVNIVNNTGKIEIGNKNILGIVSATPSIVAGDADFHWTDKYIKDDFGIRIQDEYKYFYSDVLKENIYINEQNNLFVIEPQTGLFKTLSKNEITIPIELKVKKLDRINPAFNSDNSYIPRNQRKEWAVIGLIGQLLIRTAENITSSFVDINEQGMAINGTKYVVLKMTKIYDGKYGIVQIFFK